MSEIGLAVRKISKPLAIAMIVLGLTATSARAQNRLGGHIGMLFPLVSHVNGETTNIGDDFSMGFPMGITVRTSDEYAFDLEFVPALDPREGEPMGVPLTVHPGVLLSLGNSWTGGLRAAFDIGAASWGFTPLINKGFSIEGQSYFVELVVPIRFQDDDQGDSHTSIGLGVHIGFGF